MLVKSTWITLVVAVCAAEMHAAAAGSFNENVVQSAPVVRTPIPTLAFTPPPKPANATWGISTIIRAPNGTIIGTQVAYGTGTRAPTAVAVTTSAPVPAVDTDADTETDANAPVKTPTWATSTIIRDENGTIIGTETNSGTGAPTAPTPIPTLTFTPPPKPANATTASSTIIRAPNGTIIGTEVTYGRR